MQASATYKNYAGPPALHAAFFGAVAASAMLIVGMPFVFAALAAVVPLVAVTRSRPEVWLLAVAVLVSSIIYENVLPLVPIPVGIGSLYISDMFLFYLLGLLFFKAVSDPGFRFARSPLSLPILAFVGMSVVSAYIALARYGVPKNLAMSELRVASYYLLFFPAANLLKEKKQVVFMARGLIWVAVFVAIVMAAQAAAGESLRLTFGRVETLETMGERYGGVTRILPPGQTLVYVVFITLFCILTTSGGTLAPMVTLVQLGLVGAALVLTFNRNYWVSCMLAVAALAFIAPARQKLKIIAFVALAALMLWGASFFMDGSPGRAGRFYDAAGDRLMSIVAGRQVVKSQSLEFRQMENEYAYKQIKAHPWLGKGLANEYRPPFFDEEPDTNLVRYIHNGYLWILISMGALGLVPLLWMFGAFIWRGLASWKRFEDGFLKAVVIGFTLSAAGFLAAAVVNPIFMQWFSVTAFALMMGTVEAALRLPDGGRGEA